MTFGELSTDVRAGLWTLAIFAVIFGVPIAAALIILHFVIKFW